MTTYEPAGRICILLGKFRDPATERQAFAGEIPWHEYLVVKEALGADLLDYSDVMASSHPIVAAARKRGHGPGLAALAFTLRKRYDQFYCTGEDVAFPFGIMMSAAADFGRITAVIHNAKTKKRLMVLRNLPSLVWRNLICLGREQHRVIVEEARVRADFVRVFPQWVDTHFYDPSRAGPLEAPYVFACGQESRDYPTLQQAAEGSEIPFRVVASGWAPHQGFTIRDDIRAASNVTVEAGSLSYGELRQRYAAANVVAVPIKNVTYCAGVTSICEAMCMAKPVVITSSAGIVDYVEDGVSGLIVPVGDAAALRRAIDVLWSDPERRAEIGRRNRAYAETHLSVQAYAARVAGLYGLVPRHGTVHQALSA
jgi:glycosyltransferase involved in cell wall biosynthesis